MSTLEDAIAGLNAASTELGATNEAVADLVETVNVKKAVLDDAVDTAQEAVDTLNDGIVLVGNYAASAGNSANLALSKTVAGPNYKDPVRLAANYHVDLTAVLPILDGVQTVEGDRVFLPMQNDAAQNGIYIVGASGLTRASDADTAAEVASMTTWVLAGVKNRGREVRMVTTSAITLGTTKLYFSRSSGGPTSIPTAGVICEVGDSNFNGRQAWEHAKALELVGPRCPMEQYVSLNMGKNGSQISGWRTATQASSFETAPEPQDYYPVDGSANLYEVAKADPTIVLFSLGINDYNTPVGRNTTQGPFFAEHLDWAVNFLLWTTSATIVLQVPAPYGSVDFEQGSFDTDWLGGGPTGSAEDNAAYWSQVLRGHYMRWKDRDPRVKVHDTAEIFNPGATLDPTLHRCDNPKVNCLDPVYSKFRFKGSIISNVLTMTQVLGGGLLAVGDRVTVDGATNGALREIVSLGTGTGGVGTYNLSAGDDVSATIMKVPAPLLDDSLHASLSGMRRVQQSLVKLLNMEGNRSASSITRTAQGVEPFDRMMRYAHWSTNVYYMARAKSASNMLLTLDLSPESLFVKQASLIDNPSMPGCYSDRIRAESGMLQANYGKIRDIVAIRGAQIKLGVIGGTGTIYTATAVSINSYTTGLTFHVVFQFNGVDMMAEPANGILAIWVESAAHIPGVQDYRVEIPFDGERGGAHSKYPDNWEPVFAGFLRVKTSATGTDATTIKLRMHNGSTGGFTEGAVNFAGYDGMEIATLSLGTNILSGNFVANASNRDAAIAAGIWPVGTARWLVKPNYWFSLSTTVAGNAGHALMHA